MKVKMIVGLMVVLFVGSGLSLARKQEGSKGKSSGRGSKYSIMKELNLTKEQKEKIRKQKYESSRKRLNLRNDLSLKRYDLKYELSMMKIDDRKVNKLIDEISEIQKNILKNKVNSLKDFKTILTSEQWEKIKNIKVMGFGGFDNRSHMYKGKEKTYMH